MVGKWIRKKPRMPPKTVSVREAKANLSKLLAQVATGQHFIIVNRGRPVAQLTPLERAKPQRRPGVLKGRIRIAHDFDAPLPGDVLKEFDGGDSCG